MPDDIRQATSDHGWDIAAHKSFLNDVIGLLQLERHAGVALHRRRSGTADLAKEVGADRVEIYTGPYGGAFEHACDGSANSAR